MFWFLVLVPFLKKKLLNILSFFTLGVKVREGQSFHTFLKCGTKEKITFEIKLSLQKPIGHQILLDKFFLSFMNAYLVFVTWFNILDYLLIFSKPIPEAVAAVFYLFTNFNFDHVLIWIITTALIKVRICFTLLNCFLNRF